MRRLHDLGAKWKIRQKVVMFLIIQMYQFPMKKLNQVLPPHPALTCLILQREGEKVLNKLHFFNSDSDLENDLSRDDLMKILVEKERLLVTKQEELEKMKDKVLRTFAEMENVKDRTKREAENAKKFAIQASGFVF